MLQEDGAVFGKHLVATASLTLITVRLEWSLRKSLTNGNTAGMDYRRQCLGYTERGWLQLQSQRIVNSAPLLVNETYRGLTIILYKLLCCIDGLHWRTAFQIRHGGKFTLSTFKCFYLVGQVSFPDITFTYLFREDTPALIEYCSQRCLFVLWNVTMPVDHRKP